MKLSQSRLGTGAVLGIALAWLGAGFPGLDALGQEGARDSQTPRGRQLYLAHCQRCHGPEGRGEGPDAPETRVPTADLTHIAARRGGVFPKAQVTEIIDGRRYVRAHGPSGMPVWGKEFLPDVAGGGPAEVVTRDKIRELVEYLESIQQPAQPDGSPDE